MTVLLQSLTVFTTIGILIAAAATTVGKLPTRLMYITGTVVSAASLLAGLLLKDTWTITFQAIALFGWGGGLLAHTIKLRRTTPQ